MTGRVLLRNPTDSESFILYGSYARGDFDIASDVDVLRVADERALRSDAAESVTLHTYTEHDLLSLANEGNLFALHLLKEGSPLHDPRGVLVKLADAFRPPESYLRHVQRSLHLALQMLDIDELLFAQAPREFLATAAFVCRSALYAEHADRGAFSFSLRTLATSDPAAALLLSLKQATPTHQRFLKLRRVARSYFPRSQRTRSASTIDQLTKLAGDDTVARGLLRRIEAQAGSDPYVMPPPLTTTSSPARSPLVSCP